MFSQQSCPKMMNTFSSEKLSLKNRWSQIIVVFVWIFWLVSAEVSLVAAAPCTGTKGENCTSDCNVSCVPTNACNNGTGECTNNNTAEEQVTKTEILLSTNKESNEPLAPILKCEPETGDCKNNATETVISSTDTEENSPMEQVLGCEDKLGGIGGCENITTEGEIPNLDAGHASPAQIIGCEEGFYGANCSIACPANCVSPRCDHVTGDCSSGCRMGYQGPWCAETCPTGYYGNECKSKCPTNCATADCHHENGYCLTGCKEDYWGSDCSLVGEFRDNPEPAQDQFYQHLSAESKSVLLYMLMSKYEETLERAQLEVNRGLQLRNKLRTIMGG